MWPRAFSQRVGIEWPIVQAPMAGGPSTPALAAAVSEAGALGSLAGAYLDPALLRDQIRAVRSRTSRPFAANVFTPARAPRPPAAEVERAVAALAAIRAELGLEGPPSLSEPPAFEAQLAVLAEERVPVASFTFGCPTAAQVEALHRAGATVIATATAPEEARLVEAAGCDAVVAQGAEAGGNRGSFAVPFERGMTGLVALVPLVADAVRIPVLASGGIMDGRGIAAALCLGAQGVQMGTAFLACAESGAHRVHKEAVLRRREADDTRVTTAYSGRPARGFANRLMIEVERAGAILPFPHQNALTQAIRQEAARRGKADLLSLYAGQGASLSREMPAAALVERLVAETETALRKLS